MSEDKLSPDEERVEIATAMSMAAIRDAIAACEKAETKLREAGTQGAKTHATQLTVCRASLAKIYEAVHHNQKERAQDRENARKNAERIAAARAAEEKQAKERAEWARNHGAEKDEDDQ